MKKVEVPLSLDQKQLIQHSVELKKELHSVKRNFQSLQGTVDELVSRQDRLRYVAHHAMCFLLVNRASRELCSCPITQELMKEPVLASDGHVYERR